MASDGLDALSADEIRDLLNDVLIDYTDTKGLITYLHHFFEETDDTACNDKFQ